MKRTIGTIPQEDTPDYRADLLAHGLDTWVETYNVEMPDDVWAEFEGAQRAARETNVSGLDSAPVMFGGRVWHMRPWGGGGAKYILSRPEITVSIRAKDMPWNLTARYSSVGLWLEGLPVLTNDFLNCLSRAGVVIVGGYEKGITVSRLDYAFDFRAPDFTCEARPELMARFVQPTQSKGAVYTSGNGLDIRAETFRIGKMPRLQIEVYDKGREIREASGKEWFRKVWRLADDEPLDDIWRIEARFGSEYLKDRGLRERAAVREALPGMLTAALALRRLTVGNATRARRSDMHPLWLRAWHAAGHAQEVPGIDRVPTLARGELIEVLEKQMAGLTRAHSVLKHGAYADDAPADIAAEMQTRIAADRSHARKVDRAMERYRFIDEGT